MSPPAPPEPLPRPRTLLVGPGPRAQRLAGLLRALLPGGEAAVRAIDDVGALNDVAELAGLFVCDADALDPADLGCVRRFLARRPGFVLALVGTEPGTRAARGLARTNGAPWTEWPPDVEQLAAWALAVAATADEDGARAVPRGRRGDGPLPAFGEGDELEAMRAILEGGTVADAVSDAPFAEDVAAAPDAPDAPEASAADAALEDESEPPTPPQPRPQDGLGAPDWLRAQVADLADVAQRLDLSVRALADAAPEISEGDLEEARDRLRALEGEIAHLVQFARTLGYIVAPPPAGAQVFDLGEIVHLFVAGLAGSGAEAPRCQFKADEKVLVRSDRQLLGQALDALFFLARCTSRKGDLVRARTRRAADGRRAELTIEFQSGPLEGLPAEEIRAPYGLTDLFPDLGPNALAAAAGIVRGQGGALELIPAGPGRLLWKLDLPLAPAGRP